MTAAVPPEPAGEVAVPGFQLPEFHVVAAALRSGRVDLASYEAVLTGTLADALPPGMVTVERDRKMSDRLAGRPGEVRAIDIDLGETGLALRTGKGGVVAERTHVVRGVVLSRKPIGLDEWTAELGRALQARATEDARAADAVRRLLGM